MAGSYNHVVTKSGKLAKPERVCSMLECMSGDVYEAIEEFYGMVWYLAGGDADRVEKARQNYVEGLRLSPGINRGRTLGLPTP